MTNKVYTEEQIIAVCNKYAELAGDIDKYTNGTTIARDAGIQAIGEPVCYYQIRSVWNKDDRYCDIIQSGLLARAEAYVDKAERIIKDMEDKAKVYYDTWVATGGQCREMMTVINSGRFIVERCERFTTLLAPDVYGDYAHEIKRLIEGYKLLQKQIDDMVNNRR